VLVRKFLRSAFPADPFDRKSGIFGAARQPRASTVIVTAHQPRVARLRAGMKKKQAARLPLVSHVYQFIKE
jgi:hypothetical protein